MFVQKWSFWSDWLLNIDIKIYYIVLIIYLQPIFIIPLRYNYNICRSFKKLPFIFIKLGNGADFVCRKWWKRRKADFILKNLHIHPDRSQCIINNANISPNIKKASNSFLCVVSEKVLRSASSRLQNRGNINKTVTHICGVIFLASISLAPVHKMKQGAALFITGLFDCAARPQNKK